MEEKKLLVRNSSGRTNLLTEAELKNLQEVQANFPESEKSVVVDEKDPSYAAGASRAIGEEGSGGNKGGVRGDKTLAWDGANNVTVG